MRSEAIARGLKQHWTVKHGKMIPKLQFKSLAEALDYMKNHHINKNIYTPYVCRDCGLWHIGHIKQKIK